MPDLLSLSSESCNIIFSELLAAIVSNPEFGRRNAAILPVNQQIRSEVVKVLFSMPRF